MIWFLGMGFHAWNSFNCCVSKSSRLAAISQYFSSFSIPIHLRPSRSHAIAVVPDPKNGSRIMSDLYENSFKHRSGNSIWNVAGWLSFFFSLALDTLLTRYVGCNG